MGDGVTGLRPGDAVFADISGSGMGGFAEYVAVPATLLAPKPANLAFEEAAAVPLAATTALQGLRDQGRLRAGQHVLIHGASGGVGTYAVQIARALGAQVTAVCSTRKVEQVRALGAQQVIDYTQTDFSRTGETYDLIFAVNGDRSIWDYRRALRPAGIYVMAGGSTGQMFQALLLGPLLSRRGGQRLGGMLAKANQGDLLQLKAMVEAGTLKPVMDRRYTLRELPDALRYVEAGHAYGKVVVTM